MPSKDDKPVKKYTWVPKVGKKVSYKFGVRDGGYAAGWHTGTDIGAPEGAKIVWAKPNDGKVTRSAYSKDYGNYVIIKDKKVKPNATLSGDAPTSRDPRKNLGPGETLIAHMKHRGPDKGTKLRQGEKIGLVGDTGRSTGPHAHIEQTAPGDKWKYGNVVRPQLVYAANNGTAIMNRFNYVMGTAGTDGLQQTINNYRNGGNEVRTYGKPGTSSFRIEVREGNDWVKNPNIVFDKLRDYAPVASITPPTSVGTPAVAPPPTTDPGSGTPPAEPPASDPPVDPADPPVDPGDDGSDPVDPGDGTTPDEPPTDDDTGEDTTDTEDTGSDTTDTGDTGDGSGTEDSYDETGDPGDGANQGDAPGTESTDTTDTVDNAGATDKSTLDTKRKGATASKAELRRQERIASGVNDVDLTKAAQKSQSLLAADRNNDQKVSKQEQKVFNPADSNNNGTVNAKELKKYIATVDLDKDNKVKPAEAKAFRTLDSNDDKNIGNKELKAFNTVAGEDGKISRKEAKDALKAQIDTKQDQREHDLAVEYLRRTNEQKGGSQAVGEQAAALAVSQPAKHNNKDHDGPGGKGKGKGKGKG